ncbi:MAG: transketolase [Clostridiales bacterium]|nr:transketolase [Clostridiales bacterium]
MQGVDTKGGAGVEAMRRLSADIRIETIRALAEAGFGHIGGSASIADVLGVLYGGVMRIDPANPGWAERDWLVLSKGHCGPALYAALALKGFFPMDWLKTVNKGGTRLPSHADRRKTPGVDMSTGSLGQGISAAVGIALGNKTKGFDNYTYCIVGDGELNEGQIWEAAQSANTFGLDRFILFVDWNKKQLDGELDYVSPPLDIRGKFESFGFQSQTVKGYDAEAIYTAICRAKEETGKPSVIILDTLKGLGVSFAERESFNHYMTIDEGMAKEGIEEIERRYAAGTYPGGDLL